MKTKTWTIKAKALPFYIDFPPTSHKTPFFCKTAHVLTWDTRLTGIFLPFLPQSPKCCLTRRTNAFCPTFSSSFCVLKVRKKSIAKLPPPTRFHVHTHTTEAITVLRLLRTLSQTKKLCNDTLQIRCLCPLNFDYDKWSANKICSLGPRFFFFTFV